MPKIASAVARAFAPTQSPTRSRVRSLAVAVAALFAALAVAASPAAHAQAAQMVGTPLTTKRLERLLKVYVTPTDDESAAIDRLHEAYLDKFRAELDPEIQAVGKSISGTMPSRQQFEKFLRDLDRLQGKMAEADNAFLDSASNLVAESRRAGLQRIREARERQRQLSGFARMAPMMFGGGGSFVDLADLLARDEYVRQVPEGAREQFDALLRAQEQRLLSQSRNYSEAIRKSMNSFFDIMEEAQGASAPAGTDADTAAEAAKAQMERMQQMMARMREVGKEPRKAISSNLDANRTALRSFAAVLPERTFHRLRREIAMKSMGMMGGIVNSFGGGVPPSLNIDAGALVARLRRDRDVSAETRAQLDQIELAWRRESADAAERLAELILTLDQTQLFGAMGGDNAGADNPMAKLTELKSKSDEADQRAYRAIRDAIGGEKGARLFGSLTPPGADAAEGARKETLYPAASEPAPAEAVVDSDAQPATGSIDSLYNAPRPWTAQDIARIYRALGVPESSLAVLEGVVDAWTAKEWTAKVVPLGDAIQSAVQKMYTQQDGQGFTIDREQQTKASTLRRKMIEAIFAADQALCGDLATALGLEPDGAEMLSLRLERVGFININSPMAFGRSGAIPAPSQVIVRAKIPADAARALLAGSKAEWKALADELPALTIAELDRSVRSTAMQSGGSFDSEAFRKTIAESARASRELSRRFATTYDGAAEKATSDAETRAAIRRARLAVARPDVYTAADAASAQLESALRLDGISADQRARLEALRAEYDAVYEMLSEKIASGGTDDDPTDDEGFRAMQERMETEQKLRFQRTERTDKARSEARRILGDELAARVRGLVPDEGEITKKDAAGGFNPFGEDED